MRCRRRQPLQGGAQHSTPLDTSGSGVYSDAHTRNKSDALQRTHQVTLAAKGCRRFRQRGCSWAYAGTAAIASHRSATALQIAARVDQYTWHDRPAANPARCVGKTQQVSCSKEAGSAAAFAGAARHDAATQISPVCSPSGRTGPAAARSPCRRNTRGLRDQPSCCAEANTRSNATRPAPGQARLCRRANTRATARLAHHRRRMVPAGNPVTHAVHRPGCSWPILKTSLYCFRKCSCSWVTGRPGTDPADPG